MIRAERISFDVGDFRLIDFSLEVGRGSYFVMLGPPGSGKTVFLECICGLRRVSGGRIFIDGRDVTTLEPRLRGIGYVPQDYALFPHLSVLQNITFGLKAQHCRGGDISRKAGIIAEMLKIDNLLGRSVTDLSGGEKQRTALARALILEPKVLLLDEPVCALDEETRQSVCAMLHRVQRELELSVVHVSHNLEEAFSVADNAAIVNNGVLQQCGTLDALLRKPTNEFVARFMRCENIYSDSDLDSADAPEGKFKVMIRPEDVVVLPAPESGSGGANEFSAKLVRWRDYGGYVKAEFSGRLDVVAHLTQGVFAGLQVESASEFVVVLRPDKVHSFGV